MIRIGKSELQRMNWFGAKPVVARVLGTKAVNPLVQLLACKVLPERIGRRLPLARRHVDYRLNSGATIRLLDPIHDEVAKDIYWGSSQPTKRAERLKLRMLERLSRDCATFLDIGSYAAMYAMIAAAANPRLKAIAYEIVPENHRLMVSNLKENGLEDRVTAKLLGIGEKDDSISMPVKTGSASNLSSISLGSSFPDGIPVPVTTLDKETAKMASPFLMKIDVEGYEEGVFKGGRKFIRTHKPDIICEILRDAHEACELIESIVRPLGYRTFTFEEDGLLEHPKVAPTKRLRDWLILSRDDTDALVREVEA